MSDLREVLRLIEEHDTDYETRETLLYEMLVAARQLGLPCGIRIDPDLPEWPIIFVELSTGQCSWHVLQHPIAWDGHSTEEKYARVKAFTTTNN